MDAINPWEDTRGRFLDRVWATVWGATRDPMQAFRHMGAYAGERDLAAAIRFALIITIFGYGPVLVMTPCLLAIPIAFVELMPHDLRSWGIGIFVACAVMFPFAVVFGSLATDVLHAGFFHALARGLGGKGSWRASLHTMLYTSAIRFWLCPAFVLGFVPGVGPMLSLALRTGFVIWTGVGCYAASKTLHGLDENASILVGIFTPLLSVLVVAFTLGLVVFGIAVAVMGSAELFDLLGRH